MNTPLNASNGLVMGFGTFDAFHPGHQFYLEQLKALGQRLVVVIARDANVERIKGYKPLFDEDSRRQTVEEAGIADEVVLGGLSDFYRVIEEFQPDILGFGYDQKVDVALIKDRFPHLEIHRIVPYFPEKYKSSLVKRNFTSN